MLSRYVQCVHSPKFEEQMELTMAVIPGEKTSLSESEVGTYDLTVADAVWVGTALLHELNPKRTEFTTEEIVECVRQKRLTKGAYKSIWQHVNQHCVANRKPQPNRSCMLYALGQGNRRIFRSGDIPVEGRKGAPTHPEWGELPPEYQRLQQWFELWDEGGRMNVEDPLLALIGTWKWETADEYVARLRSDWGDRG
jgi:hypothetical protein